MKEKTVLSIENFTLDFEVSGKACPAVNCLNLHVNNGEIVALVGESGCGKSQTAFSSIGLQADVAKISGGKIKINGEDMSNATQVQWQKLRGNDISMIFQEPMTALNPLMKVGKQIAENSYAHGSTKAEAKDKALEMMKLVGLADCENLYNCYPHQLSGGMRQRIMIAMALINSPKLLIADEPTTALDVTIQAQIMELIKNMNKTTQTAVLLITHDLGVVKNMCDRIYIMYAGKIVENGSCQEIFSSPKHPYTQGLLASIPDIHKKGDSLYNIKGIVPSLDKRNNLGCPYANRCEKCMDICIKELPSSIKTKTGMVECHLYKEDDI